jgi:hypothetical protein
MVTDDEGPALESYSPFDESSSHGLGQELLERWKRFLGEGIDRSVYLYGEETGEKLAFCDTAARTLADRIIRLDGGQIDVDELPTWSRVLEAISPEVVIVQQAPGFLNFTPGSAKYRTVTAFFEQCREARLALFCGEERDDGWRLGLRPPVADEFQEFKDDESQDSEDSEDTSRSPAARRNEGWADLDETGLDLEVWQHHRAIRLSSVADRLVAQPLDLENVHYRGPHYPLREAVSEYQGIGPSQVSREILLRGPVGTGKTTLAFDIARNSSDRTIVLDAAATLTMDFDTWQAILRRSRPSMVIFAAVTPDYESALGRNLQILRRADLPITLYLTDDPDEWTFESEEAYGFDRIVDMQLPSEQDRRRVMEAFADELETSIPDERYELLDELYCETTPRRVREVIRRAREVGWEQSMEPIQVG